MGTSYKEVVKKMVSLRPSYKSVLWDIERLFVFWRDYCGVPIYLTKARVKSDESIYLKIKRDGVGIDEIKDLGGMRLICLFEKDIYYVHRFLLDRIKCGNEVVGNDWRCRGFDNNFEEQKKEMIAICDSLRLYSFKIFNWDKSSDEYEKLCEVLKRKKGYKLEYKKKKTGYKSIHYVLKFNHESDNRNYFLEIQLRTHVQDVWGELEHALAYKRGSVHPFIKKSMILLSEDLQNIENLYSHLRTVSDREKSWATYSNYKVNPRYVFLYENDAIPDIFKDDRSRVLYDKYTNYLLKYNPDTVSSEWLKEMRCVLLKFKESLSAHIDDPLVKYWFDMEEAFLLFCEANYVDALEKYLELSKLYQDKYCVYFRMGELYSITGDIVRSLECFDKVESLLEEDSGKVYLNQFRIKIRLALIYWSLGDDYVEIAKKEVDSAERLYEIMASEFEFDKEKKLYKVLCNNMCWYYLERYILAKEKKENRESDCVNDDEMFSEVTEKYEKIRPFLDGADVSRNLIDTAAWYKYHDYMRTKDVESLREAKELCLRMRQYKNITTYSFKSRDIQDEHFQEILTIADEVIALD